MSENQKAGAPAPAAESAAMPGGDAAAENEATAHRPWYRPRITVRRVVAASAVVATGAGMAALMKTGVIDPGAMLHSLNGFIARQGYWGVGGGVGIESAGIPIPGEGALVGAAAVAGHTGSAAALPLIIGAATAGGAIGSSIGYGIGRVAGDALAERLGRSEKRQRELKVGRYLFEKYGGRVVFAGRFVALLRAPGGYLAGANHMPYGKFLAWNTAGTLAWASLYGTGAYFAGDKMSSLPAPVKWGIIGVVVASAVAGAIFIKRKAHALEAKAELEYPGPLTFGRGARRGAGETAPEPASPAGPAAARPTAPPAREVA